MRSTILRKLSLVFLFSVLSFFAGAALRADEGDPPGRAARLSYTQGNVSLQPSGETDWSQATLNDTLTTGDRLYTDQGARAELEVGPFAVRLSEATDLTLVNLDDQTLQLGIGQGSIRVTIYDLPAGNLVEIATPNGALTITQPGSYRVDTDPNGTLVSVNQGSLQITGGGANQTLDSGQAAQLTGTDTVQVSLVAIPGQDEFDQWCAGRDGRIESSQSRQYVDPDTPGYEDLDSNGVWSEVPEYGPVWYPSGVSVGWVPYRFGHWVWVSPWGWTWVENEPWGFCPFHYGRWALIGTAWGWVPGPLAVRPVYAPALVAFAGGGGFSIGIGVQAWFPLGPRDPFFPWYHYRPGYLQAVNASGVRVTNINTIINVRSAAEVRYANRAVGFTAVSADTFRSGQSVARGLVRVPADQMARMGVVPHPDVSPARSAVFGGRGPVAAPVMRTARVTRPVAPMTPMERRPAPAEGRSVNQPQHFVTRTPPPPREVPFSAKEPALNQHPGRPLEPQQTQNLREGKPAGPMRDKEFPPHQSSREEKPSSHPSSESRPKH